MSGGPLRHYMGVLAKKTPIMPQEQMISLVRELRSGVVRPASYPCSSPCQKHVQNKVPPPSKHMYDDPPSILIEALYIYIYIHMGPQLVDT